MSAKGQSRKNEAAVSNGGITIVVGAQWGDEGKGKWIDWIAGGADIVARYQGGNNAGHTLYVKDQKVVLHQIPSGIFHPGQKCVLAAGVVINPGELVREIAKVAPFATVTPENLWLSARAHVITPWHVATDGRREAQREASSGSAIGTTKRGIGPTYSDKTARSGLRLGDYVNPQARKDWIQATASANEGFSQHVDLNKAEWEAFAAAAQQLAPFVCDAEARVREAAANGKKILMEGAQGTLLDLDHGTFPFVTSSSTIAAGACASLGIPPRSVTGIYGIAKAYLTRVGAGPFPTELLDKTGDTIRERGQEFGATTGRPRRCGWFDAVAMRYAQDVNGFDGVILNKFDILSGMDELKIAVAYEHPELGQINQFPWDPAVLAACKPVYKSFKGWHGELPKHGGIEALPKEARDYINAIEELSGIKVVAAGTGPGRDEALLGGDLQRFVTLNS
jgi:adenylosuccinate synthase